jgi:hypothetical protein
MVIVYLEPIKNLPLHWHPTPSAAFYLIYSTNSSARPPLARLQTPRFPAPIWAPIWSGIGAGPRFPVCRGREPGPRPGSRFRPGPGFCSRFCGARARAVEYPQYPWGGRLGVVLAPTSPTPASLLEMSELDAADFEVSDDDSKEGSDISESVSTRSARGARGSNFKNRGRRAGTSAKETCSNKTPSDRGAGLRQLLLKFQRRRGQQGQ